MSILNKINVDYMNQPLFLGEGLSLQRFDRFKHPVFFDLFNKQLTQFWRPEEISLALDRGQYQELADHEKFIFTKNLLFQTMLDSVVARGVPVFTQHVSNPELEICLNTWGFFENIHSYSYTYIIKNVYADPSKILDQALEDKEILLRADSVTKAYDELANEKLNIKEKIYLSLISVNILEALRFYVSFVCAFAFGENKKMIGNADIVSLIKKDESCCDAETMILTRDGWKYFEELNDEDMVAQCNENHTASFVSPSAIINKAYSGKMVRIYSEDGDVDMLLTPDHRIVYYDGDWQESKAEDFNTKNICLVPIFSYINGMPIVKSNALVKKEIIDYNGRVYCVSVPSGMFLAKRNNSMFVTGNCHLAITQNILNILRTDDTEGFVDIIKSKEAEAIKMFTDAVEEEKAWASYLFQYGSVLGLNEKILHQYIEWLADTRMNTIGLPKLYNAKNPIGSWLEPWINSASVQVAPQETEITSYLKASVNNDIGTFDFGDLGL